MSMNLFFVLDHYLSFNGKMDEAIKLAKYTYENLSSYSNRIKRNDFLEIVPDSNLSQDKFSGYPFLWCLEYVICVSLENLCYAYTRYGMWDEAEKSCKKLITKSKNTKKIHNRQKMSLMCHCFLRLGVVYQSKSRLEEAKENYQMALELAIKIDDSSTRFNALYGLGRTDYINRNYISAQQYYQKSLAECQKNGDKYNKAVVYNELGLVFAHLGKYEEALNYYYSSIEIYQEFQDYVHQAHSYHNIGLVMRDALGDLNLAEECFKTALRIWIDYLSSYEIPKRERIKVYKELAYISHLRGEQAQAESYLTLIAELELQCGSYVG